MDMEPIPAPRNLPPRSWKAQQLQMIVLFVITLLFKALLVVEHPLSSSEDEVKKEEKDDIPKMREDHPLCFSEHLFTNFATRKSLNIYEIGKYIKIGRNVTSSIRYDYTCPSTKPRYNCAKNKSETSFKYGELATHWKLSLVPRQHQEACNLWELTASLGGPIGLANNLLSQHPKSSRTIINVFIGGNSYLRQIFEALVCGFHEDITNQLVQRGAKFDISMAGLEKRGGRKVDLTEMGSLEHPPNASSGVCDYTMQTDFYEDGLQLPVVCKYNSCHGGIGAGAKSPCMGGSEGAYNDDIGMVEFGGKIRFYYMFRPYIYENVTRIFQSKLHLEPVDIDILLFNDRTDKLFEEKYPEVVDLFETKGIWRSKIIWPYTIFQKMQERDAKRWFGADNPWIDHSPDTHACMPGVPDDEVNLLLFLMLSDSVIA